MFVYYFACRYYWLNYILKAWAWAQALGFVMLQAKPKPNSSPPVGWAGPGLGRLWALGLAQHITTVNNNDSFLSWYNALMQIFKECGKATFGRVKGNKHAVNQFVTLPQMQWIQSDIKHLGGVLRMTQEHFSGEVCHITEGISTISPNVSDRTWQID